MNKETGALSW